MGVARTIKILDSVIAKANDTAQRIICNQVIGKRTCCQIQFCTSRLHLISIQNKGKVIRHEGRSVLGYFFYSLLILFSIVCDSWNSGAKNELP